MTVRVRGQDKVRGEGRGWGEVKIIKHLRTGQLRLELRGAQYREVCLSQPEQPRAHPQLSKDRGRKSDAIARGHSKRICKGDAPKT